MAASIGASCPWCFTSTLAQVGRSYFVAVRRALAFRGSPAAKIRGKRDAPEMCTILAASVTIDPGSGLVQLGGLQRDPGAALPHRCH